MKRSALIILCLFVILTVGCKSDEAPMTAGIIEFDRSDYHYYYTQPEAEIVSDPDAIADCAESCFVGRITDINFTLIPFFYSMEVCYEELATILTVDVIDVFKGDVASTVDVLFRGGVYGYKEEEQMELSRSINYFGIDLKTIIIYENSARKDGITSDSIGKAYLFATFNNEYENYGAFTQLLSHNQGLYSIDPPNMENYSGISAEGLIKELGRSNRKKFELSLESGKYNPVS